MNLKQIIQDDILNIFFNTDEFAEIGRYTVYKTKQVIENVPCVISRQAETSTEYGYSDSLVINVPESLVAFPERLDTLQVGSTVYTILNRAFNEYGVWSLNAETLEKHKP